MTGPYITGGVNAHVGPNQLLAKDEAFDRRLETAAKAGTHVWIAMQAHSITDEVARKIAEDSDHHFVMDTESLLSVGFACYRCEEILNRRNYYRRCPGEPRP